MQIELSWSFVLHLLLGGFLGLLVRRLYRRYSNPFPDSGQFANLFPLFVLATITVIVVVQLSLALSLGLIGALTIVRFRGPIKGPQELVYLLFCVSLGLALGAGHPMLSLAAFSVVALFLVFGGVAAVSNPPTRLVLTVTGNAASFFPSSGPSGLERLEKLGSFELVRLDQGPGAVEARGVVTLESDEDSRVVLERVRQELAGLSVSSVDSGDTQAADAHPAAHPSRLDVPHRGSTGVFDRIDTPTPRTVDSFRREVKFALSHADSAKIRSVLEVNCQRILHNGPVSTVHTIYFDDARLSACHENLEGVPRRAKVRLRWYDEGDGEGRLFFEVKRRIDSVVFKERVAIHSKRSLAEMTYRDILTELQRILPAQECEMLLARPEAVVLSEYRREYFGAPGSPARITLDEGIKSYSQMGWLRPSQRFGTKDESLVILEAKLPVDYTGELRELLHPLAPQITKSCKYVRACLRLGLLPEEEPSGGVSREVGP